MKARWQTFCLLGTLMARSSQTVCCAATENPGQPVAPPTFSRDIAPIIFQNCSGCHRPGQSTPFNLLNYQDVKKHMKEIAEVTARRYMPPWLPEPDLGDFVGARLLSTAQMDAIQRWVATGAVEGHPSELPALPQWNDSWQLGEPDLVVTTRAGLPERIAQGENPPRQKPLT